MNGAAVPIPNQILPDIPFIESLPGMQVRHIPPLPTVAGPVAPRKLSDIIKYAEAVICPCPVAPAVPVSAYSMNAHLLLREPHMRDEEKTKDQLIKELEELRKCVAERKQMEEIIKRQAYHDFLTGLPNRMLFIDHLVFALAQARRTNKMLAVMFLDLDRFKVINDSLGHAAGDLLLRDVSFRLRSCLRECDIIARTGGDEYAILLPQITHEDDALKIVKKIVSVFKGPFVIEGHELHVTTSIGISLYPEDGRDADMLAQNADTAMYHAKERGRNNYQFYNKAMHLKAFKKILMENSLRKALESDGLMVFYQPQVDIYTGRIICVEALVRWQHPELGLLDPKQFISLAEETGLIVTLDEWVLRTACLQAKAWEAAGHPPMCVTVNLSSREFLQPDLVERVSKILDETSLSPCFLDLEINEDTAMHNMNASSDRMEKLSDMGVQLSLDDFGKEYLSLRRLRMLPIQRLKIDRSFISGIMSDTDYKTLISIVIEVAHSLKLKVVAEGVETEDQLSFLRSRKCDEMQGYLVSHPMPAERFEKEVLSHAP